MWSIGFQTKRLDREVKRNPPVVAWCSVHKLLMMTAPSKRYKCVHNKLFAVSISPLFLTECEKWR